MEVIDRHLLFATEDVPAQYVIEECFGFISHQNISKIDVINTKFSNGTERYGLRHQSYEHFDYIQTKFLQKAPEGANAIIGVKMDSSVFSHDGENLMLITYTGTPARIHEVELNATNEQ
jgi:uncharacterized protein YbjQ (UPF0145 family)